MADGMLNVPQVIVIEERAKYLGVTAQKLESGGWEVWRGTKKNSVTFKSLLEFLDWLQRYEDRNDNYLLTQKDILDLMLLPQHPCTSKEIADAFSGQAALDFSVNITNQDIRRLLEAGHSCAEIVKFFDVTQQRVAAVWGALKRKKRSASA